MILKSLGRIFLVSSVLAAGIGMGGLAADAQGSAASSSPARQPSYCALLERFLDSSADSPQYISGLQLFSTYCDCTVLSNQLAENGSNPIVFARLRGNFRDAGCKADPSLPPEQDAVLVPDWSLPPFELSSAPSAGDADQASSESASSSPSSLPSSLSSSSSASAAPTQCAILEQFLETNVESPQYPKMLQLFGSFCNCPLLASQFKLHPADAVLQASFRDAGCAAAKSTSLQAAPASRPSPSQASSSLRRASSSSVPGGSAQCAILERFLDTNVDSPQYPKVLSLFNGLCSCPLLASQFRLHPMDATVQANLHDAGCASSL